MVLEQQPSSKAAVEEESGLQIMNGAGLCPLEDLAAEKPGKNGNP